MPKYLGKLYPVSPYQELNVVCLECLDTEKYPNANDYIVNECKEYLSQYNRGLDKKSFKGEIVYYNNSSWYMGESDNILEFVADMKRALTDPERSINHALLQ